MTEQAKKKWYASLISVLTAAAGVLAFWPSFEPALEWFLKVSMIILENQVARAVMTSIIAGVSLASFVPHIPSQRIHDWPAHKTKAVTRTVAVITTFACCLLLLQPGSPYTWAVAFFHATIAAGFSSAVWTTLSGLYYRIAPRPESLK
jgi:hypothetical protein